MTISEDIPVATEQKRAAREEWRRERKVKCLVWDLDNTLWHGILLEDAEVVLRDGIREIIQELDERGVLQSVASRNNHEAAIDKLKEFGLDNYFLFPQINWGPKSASVGKIAESINIGIDTLGFVDDQPFERDEVANAHAKVQCYGIEDLPSILERPEMTPRFVTEESKHRREMMQADIVRTAAEETFEGAQAQFLASLDMRLSIHPARETDLKRAEELTLRTNQLNTTGRTYSYDELNQLRQSPNFQLWVASLEDKYGNHGTIGLVLIEECHGTWWIRLLLMSCRVMNRGIGGVMINYIRDRARDAGVRLMAEMILNDRNRMMYMTYKFNHFNEIETGNGITIFENNLAEVQPCPDYLQISAAA